METKDLILRNWQDSDAEALYEMCLDEAIRKEKAGLISIIQLLKAGMPSIVGRMAGALK